MPNGRHLVAKIWSEELWLVSWVITVIGPLWIVFVCLLNGVIMLPWNPAIKTANKKKTSRVPTRSEKKYIQYIQVPSLQFCKDAPWISNPTQPRVEIKTSDQCCSSIQGVKTSKVTAETRIVSDAKSSNNCKNASKNGRGCRWGWKLPAAKP